MQTTILENRPLRQMDTPLQEERMHLPIPSNPRTIRAVNLDGFGLGLKSLLTFDIAENNDWSR